MRKTMRSLTVRSVLSLVLMAHLITFTPTTKARGFTTSQCAGTLTLTAGLTTITKAFAFIVFGTVNGPFNLSYTAVINGITYSASASGTCAPR
jgi:hypothetical protein